MGICLASSVVCVFCHHEPTPFFFSAAIRHEEEISWSLIINWPLSLSRKKKESGNVLGGEKKEHDKPVAHPKWPYAGICFISNEVKLDQYEIKPLIMFKLSKFESIISRHLHLLGTMERLCKTWGWFYTRTFMQVWFCATSWLDWWLISYWLAFELIKFVCVYINTFCFMTIEQTVLG